MKKLDSNLPRMEKQTKANLQSYIEKTKRSRVLPFVKEFGKKKSN